MIWSGKLSAGAKFPFPVNINYSQSAVNHRSLIPTENITILIDFPSSPSPTHPRICRPGTCLSDKSLNIAQTHELVEKISKWGVANLLLLPVRPSPLLYFLSLPPAAATSPPSCHVHNSFQPEAEVAAGATTMAVAIDWVRFWSAWNSICKNIYIHRTWHPERTSSVHSWRSSALIYSSSSSNPTQASDKGEV